ncbi:MAG: hypothetical protein M0010_21900 [Actinomycetota bacterium]|nr:hypothetical protein [Actinomycetota bacterium]
MTTTPPITDQAGRAQALVAFLLEDCPREAFTTEVRELASAVVGHEAHTGPDGFYARWFATPAARAAYVAAVLDPVGRTAASGVLADVEAMLREDFMRLALFRRFADQASAELAASQRDALASLARLLASPPRTVQDALGNTTTRRFDDAELETLASLGARHAKVCALQRATAAVERVITALCPI